MPRDEKETVKMDSFALTRFSGLFCLGSGFLLIVTAVLDEVSHRTGGSSSSLAIPTAVLWIVAYLSTTLALVGLFDVQRRAIGKWGFAGFLAAFVGQILFLGNLYASGIFLFSVAVQVPEAGEARPAILMFVFVAAVCLMVGGHLAFGVSTLRARMLSRSGSWIYIVGALLLMVPVVMGVAMARFGWELLSMRARAAANGASVGLLAAGA